MLISKNQLRAGEVLADAEIYVCTECQSWIPTRAREFHARRCQRRMMMVKNTQRATTL